MAPACNCRGGPDCCMRRPPPPVVAIPGTTSVVPPRPFVSIDPFTAPWKYAPNLDVKTHVVVNFPIARVPALRAEEV